MGYVCQGCARPGLTERGRCPECQAERKREDRERRNFARGPERWSWSRLRAKILERDGYACRVCGSDLELEVHHVNGDPSDNRTQNLETRCRQHNPRPGPTTPPMLA